MVDALILRYLLPGEMIIESYTEGFDYPNKSFIGKQVLYLTSQGRFLAVDSGGLFGSERLIEYNGSLLKIGTDFQANYIVLFNHSVHPLTFNLTVSFEGFRKLLKSCKRDMFHFTQKNCCLFQKEGVYHSGTFTFEKDKASFVCHDLMFEISYSKIRDLQYNEGNFLLQITGYFEDNYNNDSFYGLHKVGLFVFDDEIVRKLWEAKRQFESISTILSEDALVTLVNAKSKGDQFRGLLVYEDNHYRLVKEDTLETVYKVSESTHLYFDAEELRLLIVENDIIFYLTLEQNSPLLSSIKKDSEKFYSTIGVATGTFNDRQYNEKAVGLFVGKDMATYSLFFESSMEYLDRVAFSETIAWQVEDLHFLCREDGIFLFSELNYSLELKNIFHECKNANEKDVFGFLGNGMPFILKIQSDRFVLVHGKDQFTDLVFEEIKSISIAEQFEDSIFTKVKIEIDDAERIIFVPEDKIQELIYTSFLAKKAKLAMSTPASVLFSSWSRQVNDYFLYHYIGQLFVIKSAIEEIERESTYKEINNIKVVNLLYYGLQTQKQIMDSVSIYIPSMLEEEQSTFFKREGVSHSAEPYAHLRRQLMGISVQIQRHINETQANLNAISFAIIPKRDLENLNRDKLIRNGLMAGGVGLLAGPIGLIMGAHAYFSYRDNEKMDKLRKENEDIKIDFYLNKALDSFYHLLENMLPYYISEVNGKMFQSFGEIAGLHKPLLDKISLKEALLTRLAGLYTFRQLPIDHTVLTKKEELMREIHTSLSASDSLIKHFRSELGTNEDKTHLVEELFRKELATQSVEN
ncbi:hypothetical protein [Neobacillus sp. YIM B06451]|uniref:hypothetical protein n=1 Tax=Neobacillus sp. YIM B06451 TaxID=3070994 RepID=UPI00292F5FA3|nr:hypothetical protein [Neobacillus sp. YIM B06451]